MPLPHTSDTAEVMELKCRLYNLRSYMANNTMSDELFEKASNELKAIWNEWERLHVSGRF